MRKFAHFPYFFSELATLDTRSRIRRVFLGLIEEPHNFEPCRLLFVTNRLAENEIESDVFGGPSESERIVVPRNASKRRSQGRQGVGWVRIPRDGICDSHPVRRVTPQVFRVKGDFREGVVIVERPYPDEARAGPGGDTAVFDGLGSETLHDLITGLPNDEPETRTFFEIDHQGFRVAVEKLLNLRVGPENVLPWKGHRSVEIDGSTLQNRLQYRQRLSAVSENKRRCTEVERGFENDRSRGYDLAENGQCLMVLSRVKRRAAHLGSDLPRFFTVESVLEVRLQNVERLLEASVCGQRSSLCQSFMRAGGLETVNAGSDQYDHDGEYCCEAIHSPSKGVMAVPFVVRYHRLEESELNGGKMTDGELRIRALRNPLSPEVHSDLAEAMNDCPDVAFAHLVEVEVSAPDGSSPVLFVWLRGRALHSLRGALNLVSEAVAGVLPEDVFVDVVILNSAPEILLQVEAVQCLLAEPDPDERQRALRAGSSGDPLPALEPKRNWWWPF